MFLRIVQLFFLIEHVTYNIISRIGLHSVGVE